MAKKKALLVGINDYAPVGAGGPDLRGCVNDVGDMAHTLTALGVVPASPAAVRILTNAAATRKNILAGLGWLVANAKPGDTLIFHYSGHGTQVVDTDHDEVDARDEAICPHDFAAAGFIKDDDLRKAFAAVPATANLDVFLDSCFSGTGTRDLPSEGSAFRYIEPPIDHAFFIDENPELPPRRLLRGKGAERQVVLAPGLNHVLWAGCRDNQTSQETVIGGVPRGVYTYFYCKALRGAGVHIPRAKLDALVCADIKKAGFAQVPQLEGTRPSLVQPVFT